MLELWWLGQAGFRLRDPAGGPVVFCDPFLTAERRAHLAGAGRRRRRWRKPTWSWCRTSTSTTSIGRRLQAAAARPGSRFTLVAAAAAGRRAATGARLASPSASSAPSPTAVDARRRARPSGPRPPRRQRRRRLHVRRRAVQWPGALPRLRGRAGRRARLPRRRLHPVPRPGRALRALQPASWRCCRSTAATSSARREDNIVGNMDFREAARLANDMGVEVLVPMHWELFAGNRGFPGDLVRLRRATLSGTVGSGHGPRRALHLRDRRTDRRYPLNARAVG